MHQTQPQATPTQTHRRLSFGFLDTLIENSLPPDAPLDYIGVKGPFSHDAELDIRHGDKLGVVPDDGVDQDDPDDILVMQYGRSCYVRRRKHLLPMLRRWSMYVIGRGGQPGPPCPRIPYKVLGRVVVIAGTRRGGVFVVKRIGETL